MNGQAIAQTQRTDTDVERGVIVVWDQTWLVSMRLENHFAKLTAPFDSITFAAVCRVKHGWSVEVFPHGRMKNQKTYTARYATIEKAKAQIERWTRAHWRCIDPRPSNGSR